MGFAVPALRHSGHPDIDWSERINSKFKIRMDNKGMKELTLEVLAWMSIAKGNDICPCLVCAICSQPIQKTKLQIQRNRFGSKNFTCKSKSCNVSCNPLVKLQIEAPCSTCGALVKRRAERKGTTKSDRVFCNQSCAAKYNNCHKTHGTKRSKLEAWIESELVKLYPNLEFHFNRKDAINSELDIYIPSLKLAFELNGIYHYEPIHGIEKLTTIQNNDSRKLQACIERGISFCTVDTSASKSFKPERDRKYLEIICRVINGAGYPD